VDNLHAVSLASRQKTNDIDIHERYVLQVQNHSRLALFELRL
jgi:hypothetical protein